MSVPFVRSEQVTQVNGEDFAWPANPNGVPNGMQIPCESTQIVDAYWRIPQTQGPRVIGYTYLVANDANKPQEDAIKILRVKLTGTGGITQVDMAILDSDNIGASSPPNYFAFLCDGAGGSLPVMPTVTIPVPIMQQGPQSIDNTTGAKTFIFAFPSNPDSLEYDIRGIWFDGLPPTPAYSPSGITTVAGVAAYAVTNWSDYGAWTNPSTNVLQLVNTPSDLRVLKAGIDVALEPTDYCFDLSAYSTPAAVDGVKFGASATIPLDAFMLTNNPVTLYNVLKGKMSSGTTFDTSSVANKLGINSVQAVPSLYSGTSLVVTATAGAC